MELGEDDDLGSPDEPPYEDAHEAVAVVERQQPHGDPLLRDFLLGWGQALVPAKHIIMYLVVEGQQPAWSSQVAV